MPVYSIYGHRLLTRTIHQYFNSEIEAETEEEARSRAEDLIEAEEVYWHDGEPDDEKSEEDPEIEVELWDDDEDEEPEDEEE